MCYTSPAALDASSLQVTLHAVLSISGGGVEGILPLVDRESETTRERLSVCASLVSLSFRSPTYLLLPSTDLVLIYINNTRQSKDKPSFRGFESHRQISLLRGSRSAVVALLCDVTK